MVNTRKKGKFKILNDKLPGGGGYVSLEKDRLIVTVPDQNMNESSREFAAKMSTKIPWITIDYNPFFSKKLPI